MKYFDVTLNAGTLLALHMTETALRKHLGADEILWSTMQISEGMAVPGYRVFTIKGLTHSPEVQVALFCQTSVSIKKMEDGGWLGYSVTVLCGPDNLPEEINPVTFYYCEGAGFPPGPHDVQIPSRRTRHRVSA